MRLIPIASLDASDKILHQLLQAESTERSIRSIRYQTNAARFPVLRHLQGFDFSQSKVDQQMINLLATMQFTEAIQNLVLVGGTGTGKTHLAIAIGVSGIYSTTIKKCVSTVPLIWPICWSKRKLLANREEWR
jgi:DNA replication protein DnaC